MKLKNRAMVPIGVIVLVIIVIVAGLGIWWWFTQRGIDCSDIEETNLQGTQYTWEVKGQQYHPTIYYYQNLAPSIPNHWRIVYVALPNNNIAGLWYGDLDTLRDNIEFISMSDEDKARAYHIIDCINAESNCPDC